MKFTVVILTLSLVANLALAGWWIARSNRTATASVPTATDAPVAAVAAPKKKIGPTAVRAVASPLQLPASVRSWKDLQSTDLKEFVRRLRAASCPEETIQDIILAEVNRRYAAKNRELFPDNYANKPFWETQKANQDVAEIKKNRERQRRSREMQKEKSALLVELLGVDPELERRKADGLPEYYDYYDSQVSFLPESKREAVRKYLDDFQDKQQEFYARNRGLYDAQYRDEQKQLEAERMQGLAQFLSPQELREFELRQSQMASQLSSELQNTKLTREQYETLFDIRKKFGDSIYNYADSVENPQEGSERAAKNMAALQAELTTALGPDTAKEIIRGRDYGYQQLNRLAQRNDLPADTVKKVYDFKDTAEASVKLIQADKNLTNEQLQEAFTRIRDETQSAVREALGGAAYTNYIRQGGYWINSIAPMQPRTGQSRLGTVIPSP